ncbi:MAG: amidase [Acidimicrobiaceae bacterium]|nr:amidase [Acidimicrobiaceae bacterium]
MAELWRLGAAELAELIRKGETSSREVVDSHLDRIAAVNPSLNAITVTLAETARAAADEADAATAAAGGDHLGPLHGVPFTVKENIDLTGSATTQGLVAFEQMQPDLDAPHIAQMKAAGAIPIGRTNLPDFGLRWHSDNALRGATKNPWDATRTAGGSSGGEAASLATGMTPLGMGNDYGGSLRVPAQFCGIASLRPTLGRVAQASAFQPADFPISLQLMAVQGPMARRIADVRLAFESMCGPDPRDPWWTPAPMTGPAVARRVAVWRGADDPQVAGGIDVAADALADAGYEVEEADPPMLAQAAILWQDLVLSDAQGLVDMLRPLFGADALRFLELAGTIRPGLDGDAYRQGLVERQGIARAWSMFQAQSPLILGPVSTRPPFVVGRDIDGAGGTAEVLDSLQLTVVVNLLGLPASVVPVGVSSGLPQVVQLIGPRYREDLCLDAAQAIEDRVEPITPIDPR